MSTDEKWEWVEKYCLRGSLIGVPLGNVGQVGGGGDEEREELGSEMLR